MSFKAYLDNIHAKTGKAPHDFRRMAEEKGFVSDGAIADGVKAGEIINWLKEEFDLGRGHAMAIVALLKGHKDAPVSRVSRATSKTSKESDGHGD